MSNRNKARGTWASDSLLPLILPEFQVPRKAVFYHHQGEQEAPEPPKANEAATHQTHQPVSAPCTPLVCSLWQPMGEGYKPPTTSTTVLRHASLRAHQGELSSNEKSLQNCSHMEKCYISSYYPLMIWFQSEVRFRPQYLTSTTTDTYLQNTVS